MAEYALLGATGHVGSAVLQAVLEASANAGTKKHIKVLIRSRPKFEKQLQSDAFRSFDHSSIEVFETSDISNVDILVNCIRGTRAVFMCVAAYANIPNCKIAQDQAQAVVSALQRLRSEDEACKLPRLVVLGAAPAEIEAHFFKGGPRLAQKIFYATGKNLYDDLILAERYLRQHQDWLDFCMFKPGGISWDKSRGHQIRFDKAQSFIAYVDVAGGMLEVADEESGKYNGKCVSVVSPGGKAKTEWSSIPLLLKGLVVSVFPRSYSWLF